MVARRTQRLRQFITAPWPAQAVLVGGAVRDALMGHTPTDFDWLVPNPEASATEYANVHGGSVFALNVAQQHWRVLIGTVTHDFVPLPPGPDGLEHDLARRDFTINAAALTRQGELIDPHGAARAATQKRLALVSSNALLADPVRILRAARFVASHNLTLSRATQAAVLQASRQVRPNFGAPERQQQELSTILLGPRPAYGVQLLHRFEVLEVLFPELKLGQGLLQGGFHHLDVFDHSLEVLAQVVHMFPEASLALRLAALLHDIAKPATYSTELGRVTFYSHARLGADMAAEHLRRLRYPRSIVTEVEQLVRYHMVQLPATERQARRFVHRRRALLPNLLRLMIADRAAARGPLAHHRQRNQYRMQINRVLKVLAEPPPPKPLLTGREVMDQLGIPPGPRVGKALAFVAESRAAGDIATRSDALKALKRFAVAQGWLAE